MATAALTAKKGTTMYDRFRIKYSNSSPKGLLQMFADSLQAQLNKKKTLDQLPTFIELKE
jgi:hypothetical protein